MASNQEMLDRIAKLSNAIEQQKMLTNSIRGKRGSYVSRSRGRGSFIPPYSNLRGRGGIPIQKSMSPIRQNIYYPSNKYVNPSISLPSSPNRTLILTNNNNVAQPSTPLINQPIPESKSHHRKLIINHKGTNTTTNSTMVKSIDPLSGRKQVTINGADFVVKGKKLIRKDLLDSNNNPVQSNHLITAPKVLIRRSIKSLKKRDKNKNMVLGKIVPKQIRRHGSSTSIHRHKKGNMVFKRGPEGYVRQGRTGKSLVLNSRTTTIKKPRYCGFYTRYGKCPNGSRCPFLHDPNRRAICPRFLQNRCKKTASTCRLSHTPSPHIMPHCVHFQKGHCTNDPCIYMHVKVSSDAPVCRAFAMEGYCPKGLECDEKHIHVCPEFAETGKCSNANCRLPHVARRTATTSTATNNKDGKKQSGIVRLSSWMSPSYFYAQKTAKAEKKKVIEEAAASKVWTHPDLKSMQGNKPITSKDEIREKEEAEGFIRLFDESDDDDGWSQYEIGSDVGDSESLRFKEEEEGSDEELEDELEEGEINEDTENLNIIDQKEDEGMKETDEESEDEFQDALEELIDEEDTDNEDNSDSDIEEIYEEVSDIEMTDDDNDQ
ncbi:uncharacterized protein BX663DRAFT_492947 [Cokeromyces recurvatus]|uniref:uncharacterized protein n=1 Tax=Cokeromyces recurvatus TaxID=90255 RepID=UPI00222021C2|nr:uncharacterized protein BX663DRAFT_492947 [Cokeromyces recurvatus]KAI7908089.1 hypothetical protein BX663DRAFT_492947 [Cokeromyces recurvatus]